MRALNKEILRLAVPSILANITIPLVGLVDLAIAGHLTAGEAATLIGGISIGSMLFDLLYWNFGFLRVGTGGMTAQAWGRGDRREMASLLVRGVGLALMIAAVMLLLQWPFVEGVFLFVDCSPQVRELAEQYFFIRIWAAPASLALMAFRGWFIGMQDSVSSMLTDLVVNGVNIVASLLLARAIGFAGIAAGTVTAQYAGLLFATVLALAKYRQNTFKAFTAADLRRSFSGGELRKFMKINGDLFIRSLSMVAVYIGFTILSARYGDLMLATASILMKLLLLFSYFTDGFAYAGEALTGRFFGERNRDMVRETVRWTFVWSMGIGLGFVLVYLVGATPLLRILTDDRDVIEACRLFFVWLLPMPLIGCAAFTWDGIYVGVTASVPMRDSTVLAAVAFFAFWLVGISLLDVVKPGLSAWPSPVAGADARQVAAIQILLAAYFAHLAVRTLWLTYRYRPSVLANVPRAPGDAVVLDPVTKQEMEMGDIE
ncbi:MAG: MATE family efflux transporter [Bacteroidales bacterium]|nr:MATE family efflux transporter [Bacteroidales bacterium]